MQHVQGLNLSDANMQRECGTSGKSYGKHVHIYYKGCRQGLTSLHDITQDLMGTELEIELCVNFSWLLQLTRVASLELDLKFTRICQNVTLFEKAHI